MPHGLYQVKDQLWGDRRDWTPFFIINADTIYNALIIRPWMYKYQEILSTFHLCIKYPWQDKHGTIVADSKLFRASEAFYIDANFYHKEKTHPIAQSSSSRSLANVTCTSGKLWHYKLGQKVKTQNKKASLLPEHVAKDLILPLA